MFVKITYELTIEAAAEHIARAGGRGTNEEIEAHIAETRFRQRVRINNSAEHVSGMWAHGYRVARIDEAVPPIA